MPSKLAILFALLISCCHAFGAGMTAGTTTAVRERGVDIAGIKGAAKADRVLTQSYLPGNSAWRPPTC